MRRSWKTAHFPLYFAQTPTKHLPQVRGFLPVGLAEAGALKKPGRKEGAALQTNDFLLYNEVVYRIHACRTMEEFPTILLTQVKLLIPYAYGSFIPIHTDPKTQEVTHGEPCCYPPSLSRRRRGGSRPSTGGTACAQLCPRGGGGPGQRAPLRGQPV